METIASPIIVREVFIGALKIQVAEVLILVKVMHIRIGTSPGRDQAWNHHLYRTAQTIFIAHDHLTLGLMALL